MAPYHICCGYDIYILSLTLRQIVGSHAVAQEVVRVLREVVAASRAPSFEALVQLVEETGEKLADAGKKGNSALRKGVYSSRKQALMLHTQFTWHC